MPSLSTSEPPVAKCASLVFLQPYCDPICGSVTPECRADDKGASLQTSEAFQKSCCRGLQADQARSHRALDRPAACTLST